MTPPRGRRHRGHVQPRTAAFPVIGTHDRRCGADRPGDTYAAIGPGRRPRPRRLPRRHARQATDGDWSRLHGPRATSRPATSPSTPSALLQTAPTEGTAPPCPTPRSSARRRRRSSSPSRRPAHHHRRPPPPRPPPRPRRPRRPRSSPAPPASSPATPIRLDAAGFKPGSDVVITLESDPVNLGTFVADSAGRIATSVVVPADFPAGNHTLKLTGTDIAGASSSSPPASPSPAASRSPPRRSPPSPDPRRHPAPDRLVGHRAGADRRRRPRPARRRRLWPPAAAEPRPRADARPRAGADVGRAGEPCDHRRPAEPPPASIVSARALGSQHALVAQMDRATDFSSERSPIESDRETTSTAPITTRPRSSDGQSDGLLIRGSQVRILPGAPPFRRRPGLLGPGRRDQ